MICLQCGNKMKSLGTIDNTWREYQCTCGYKAMRHIHHFPLADGSITRTLPCTKCRFNGKCSWQPHRKPSHSCIARSTTAENAIVRREKESNDL